MFRDVFIASKSVVSAFKANALFISVMLAFVVSVVFVLFKLDWSAFSANASSTSLWFAFVAKVVFVACRELRSAFVPICALKTLVSIFVAKDAVVVLASAFNTNASSTSVWFAFVAKVAFVAFNALKSAFNAIPVLYVVVSDFAVNPASTCVCVYRRVFSGFRHSWACVVVVEKVYP